MQERAAINPEKVDEEREREVVLRHVTTLVARSVEIGNAEACAFDKGEGKRGEEEHCLVELQTAQVHPNQTTVGCSRKATKEFE